MRKLVVPCRIGFHTQVGDRSTAWVGIGFHTQVGDRSTAWVGIGVLRAGVSHGPDRASCIGCRTSGLRRYLGVSCCVSRSCRVSEYRSITGGPFYYSLIDRINRFRTTTQCSRHVKSERRGGSLCCRPSAVRSMPWGEITPRRYRLKGRRPVSP